MLSSYYVRELAENRIKNTDNNQDQTVNKKCGLFGHNKLSDLIVYQVSENDIVQKLRIVGKVIF